MDQEGCFKRDGVSRMLLKAIYSLHLASQDTALVWRAAKEWKRNVLQKKCSACCFSEAQEWKRKRKAASSSRKVVETHRKALVSAPLNCNFVRRVIQRTQVCAETRMRTRDIERLASHRTSQRGLAAR